MPLPRRLHSHRREPHPLPKTPTADRKHPCCNTHCPGTPPTADKKTTPAATLPRSFSSSHRKPTPIPLLPNTTEQHPLPKPPTVHHRGSTHPPNTAHPLRHLHTNGRSSPLQLSLEDERTSDTRTETITPTTPLFQPKKRTPQAPTRQKRSSELPGCP